MQLLREIGSDAATSLYGDAFPLEAVRSPHAIRRRLYGTEHTVRRHGRRISRLPGETGHVSGLQMNVGHVLGGRPHIFRGDVAAAKALDKTTVSTEDLLTVLGLVVADDDRLAAAKMKSRHGVLVSHAARKSEGIRDRFLVGRVLPEPRSTKRRTELGAVDGENASISNRGIAAHHDFLVTHFCQRVE